MAAGLPVICLDGKGNRDLIEQNKNGIMLYDSNQEKFANEIVNLWNNKSKYFEMSVYAGKFAEKFDIKQYVALLEFYIHPIILVSQLGKHLFRCLVMA